ncbi:uncharacterized protein V2V93DRAFT_375793 [Kockiozyma suomiensis]|uniref:uncharacterized protein n=1 Tax=Kockiozyma suomiensis TaxID=1337062 RepID=UPI003343C8D2
MQTEEKPDRPNWAERNGMCAPFFPTQSFAYNCLVEPGPYSGGQKIWRKFIFQLRIYYKLAAPGMDDKEVASVMDRMQTGASGRMWNKIWTSVIDNEEPVDVEDIIAQVGDISGSLYLPLTRDVAIRQDNFKTNRIKPLIPGSKSAMGPIEDDDSFDEYNAKFFEECQLMDLTALDMCSDYYAGLSTELKHAMRDLSDDPNYNEEHPSDDLLQIIKLARKADAYLRTWRYEVPDGDEMNGYLADIDVNDF